MVFRFWPVEGKQLHPSEKLAATRRTIAGEQIESSKTALQTGLAVGTVRRAINILVKERLVQSLPGRGSFVKR